MVEVFSSPSPRARRQKTLFNHLTAPTPMAASTIRNVASTRRRHAADGSELSASDKSEVSAAAVDNAVARVSSTSARAKYCMGNLYVRIRLALVFQKATVREGFRVGGFTNAMGGMALRLLSLNGESLNQILRMNRLVQAFGTRVK